MGYNRGVTIGFKHGQTVIYRHFICRTPDEPVSIQRWLQDNLKQEGYCMFQDIDTVNSYHMFFASEESLTAFTMRFR